MEMESIKKHRAAIMVMNVIVALLCIAAIAGYFFMPLLTLRVKVDLSAQDLEDMVGSSSQEIVFSDPAPVDVELSVDTMEFVLPLFNGDPALASQDLISAKVDSLSRSIGGKMKTVIADVTEGTIRNTASKIVSDKAKETIKDALPDLSDDEVTSIMEEADITDEYLNEKTQSVIDALYEEDASVEKVSELAVEAVDEVFTKLQSTGREELSGLTMTEETAQQIRDVVSDSIGDFADDEGKLNADDIIDRILEELAGSLGGGTASAAPLSPVISLSAAAGEDAGEGRAADASGTSSAEDALAENISSLILSRLDVAAIANIFVYVAIGVAVLVLISMAAWLYLLIKVFVKGFTMNPAVKLKMPIIFLGWLPALFFFIIPSIALIVFNSFGGISALLGEELALIAGISFQTSGIIALIAAALLIVLFIPYGIVRKKLRLELTPRVSPQEEAAYYSANPNLAPQEPIYKEHTVNGDSYAAPEGTPAPAESETPSEGDGNGRSIE